MDKQNKQKLPKGSLIREDQLEDMKKNTLCEGCKDKIKGNTL